MVMKQENLRIQPRAHQWGFKQSDMAFHLHVYYPEEPPDKDDKAKRPSKKVVLTTKTMVPTSKSMIPPNTYSVMLI